MTTVFKRMAVGGQAAVFKATKVYRPGAAAAAATWTPPTPEMPVAKALAAAKTHIAFLETETLKGLPVNKSITTKSIDPYFAAYIKDVHSASLQAIDAALLPLAPHLLCSVWHPVNHG
eukprot:CAMPEP_0172715540 /NCGR_PEP_ID=MMETSP1074-20121228/67606_1 /TAXON_ID=2916 /ORGANISM="Ceratium fusus, Strain PA161109" /LENGTH=117 /DNA_ID=CAMNT_0013540125 /DNA_START=53 /DNA_END=403 /DNA_ORIENTATION=-